jgi:ribonuclease HII
MSCSWRYERQARRAGYQRIAGVDEVGRGSLIGPVVAAAVILDPDRPVRGLQDSKTLSPARRAELAAQIRERAVAWAVAQVDAARIDAWNIHRASCQAMREAVLRLAPPADFLLTDAFAVDLPLPQRNLIRGDARCASIAAASILAKEARDRLMDELAEQYPHYGLQRNRGYATAEHLEALRRHGPSPLHRFSFAPVRAAASWSSRASQQLLPLQEQSES